MIYSVHEPFVTVTGVLKSVLGQVLASAAAMPTPHTSAWVQGLASLSAQLPALPGRQQDTVLGSQTPPSGSRVARSHRIVKNKGIKKGEDHILLNEAITA